MKPKPKPIPTSNLVIHADQLDDSESEADGPQDDYRDQTTNKTAKDLPTLKASVDKKVYSRYY